MCKWNITKFILTYPHPPNCNNHKHTWKVIQREFMTKQIHRVQSKLFQKYVKGIIQLNTCTCVVFISFTCLEAIPLFNNKVKFKYTCTCMPLNNDQFFFISKYIIFIIYYVRKDGIPPQAQVSEVDQLWNNFHLRGLLEFLDLVFLLQNSVEKNLNVSPIIDIGMSRPRLPHYWPNGDPDPVN